jgi:NADH-quinone oxidoreductase subunit L
VIDGGIDGIGRATVGGGRMLSFLQSGMLQYNLMVMFAVLALVALYFFF